MSQPATFDVALIGSGFASSILARILASRGVSVAIVERGQHPRFALGESTTPLANLALERIAERNGFQDLADLATYGRWQQRQAHLNCGLKRGFTFYSHRRNTELAADSGNTARLLVAASLDDENADTHWLRADVDLHLLEEAKKAGARYFDATSIDSVEVDDSALLVVGRRGRGRFRIKARQIVDGSGRGGCLARALSIPARPTQIESALIYAHVAEPPTLSTSQEYPPGPYPDEIAAVHHLLEEGWVYHLRFGHQVSSIGLILFGNPSALDPQQTWRETIRRYPTLARQLGDPELVTPFRFVPRMQHRLAACGGERWFLLPHSYAFFDPMFSTGIAWSLLAVERLADVLVSGESGLAQEYRRLLESEANQIERLIGAAYHAARTDFDLFCAVSILYFATVSRAEVRQRLALGSTEWSGFLDADSSSSQKLFATLESRLSTTKLDQKGAAAIRCWLLDSIREFDIAGFSGEPVEHNLYPVDLEALVERHELLGLSRSGMLNALPKLRGHR